MDMIQAEKVRTANRLMSEARQNLTNAKRHVPEMSYVTPEQLKELKLVLNLLVDNIVTDSRLCCFAFVVLHFSRSTLSSWLGMSKTFVSCLFPL
jgi:hypothetical protein